MRTRRLTLSYPVVVLAVCASFALLPISGASSPPAANAQGAAAVSGLHVVGNQLLSGAGQPVRLRGVNRAGTEYACIQGWGIFDGPADAVSIQATIAWHTNAVRIPLNEDCWLAINGAAPAYSGAAYQAAIASYVAALNNAGLVAILDLHWTAPGTEPATAQHPMPDRDHSVTFWSQVANAYKTNSAVIFELFNEPYPDNNQNTTAGWQCWRDGGTCPGVGYQAAGMQELVTAVWHTGAPNVILLGGLEYSNALSQWLTYKPTDPTGNLGAAWHVYNFNLCNQAACYDTTTGPVALQVPLVATEIGEDDGGPAFIDPLMSWLDARGQSYLAWTWDTWGCGGPVLISNYNGTPCQTFGQGYKDHLAALATTPPPTNTPVLAAPTPTASLAVSPSPAPPPVTGANVGVSVVPSGAGRLQASIAARTPACTPNNQLQSLRFEAGTNAAVEIDGQARSLPFTVTLPAGTTQKSFALIQLTSGQAATVSRLVAVDSCGDWVTLVGGGPQAFQPSGSANLAALPSGASATLAGTLLPTRIPTATPSRTPAPTGKPTR
jgi:hypothetical protein